MLGMLSKCKKMTKVGIKESFSEASLGWNCFGLYNEDCEYYTFKKNTYVILYASPMKVEGLVFLIDTSSQNNLMKYLTIKRHLNIYDNEMSTVINNYLETLGEKEKEYQTLFIDIQNNYRKMYKKEMEEFVDNKLGDSEFIKDPQEINKR